jgi:hypothetical protein
MPTAAGPRGVSAGHERHAGGAAGQKGRSQPGASRMFERMRRGDSSRGTMKLPRHILLMNVPRRPPIETADTPMTSRATEPDDS